MLKTIALSALLATFALGFAGPVKKHNGSCGTCCKAAVCVCCKDGKCDKTKCKDCCKGECKCSNGGCNGKCSGKCAGK
ncbi:MAG: hypothetical protein LDL55_10770 [Armatimonadetes bacterium]|nr:hypothetical protein [Armatimonadota bacterium]